MKTTDQEPPAETAVDDGPSSMSRRASGKKYQRASRSDNMSLDGTDSDDDSSMLPATTSAEIEPNNVVAAGTVVADGGAAARRVGVQDHTALDPTFVSSVSVTVHRMECTVGQMVKTSDVPPHKRRRFGPTLTKKKPDLKDQGGEEGGVVGKSNTDSPQLLQMKEEQEELLTSPLEEADIMKMTSTAVPVKSEDDVETPQSSWFNQTQDPEALQIKEEQEAYSLSRTSTEQMKMEPDRVDCGLLEPKLEEADLSMTTVHPVKCEDGQENAQPFQTFQTQKEKNGEAYSLSRTSTEQMTDDSDEWERETSEPHPGSKSLTAKKIQSSAASSRELSQRIVKKTSKAQEAGEDITLDILLDKDLETGRGATPMNQKEFRETLTMELAEAGSCFPATSQQPINVKIEEGKIQPSLITNHNNSQHCLMSKASLFTHITLTLNEWTCSVVSVSQPKRRGSQTFLNLLGPVVQNV